ncbi:DNA-binding protein [Bacteroides heparinolyticus]|uniref:DNA-binding protein n=1 Tax=Prevotella heparinolytica TaxID=28113 RepID=A0A3P2AAM2_9BACE|nr:helix-turn-helix domain-containing protein [Bacteroides heparinolyticus]RRD92451.1 DNA-binding protein [Bacteroides heparinolyticus]
MDVITIESKAYHELLGKIEKILRYVEKEEKAKTEYENRLITNEELAGILGISKRTLQRMRSADRISYRIIYGRCYYDLHDIEEAIRNRSLYCNPKNMEELRHNFKLKSRRIKDGTIG